MATAVRSWASSRPRGRASTAHAQRHPAVPARRARRDPSGNKVFQTDHPSRSPRDYGTGAPAEAAPGGDGGHGRGQPDPEHGWGRSQVGPPRHRAATAASSSSTSPQPRPAHSLARGTWVAVPAPHGQWRALATPAATSRPLALPPPFGTRRDTSGASGPALVRLLHVTGVRRRDAPADPVMPSCAPARCRVGAGPAGRLGCAPGAASPRACAWLGRPARPRLAQTDTCTSLRLARGLRAVWGRTTVRGVGSGARECGGLPLPRTRPGCRCRAAAWGMGPLAWGMGARPGWSMCKTHMRTHAQQDHSGWGPRRVGLYDAAGGGAMGGRWRGGGRGVCWAGSAPLPSTRPSHSPGPIRHA